MAQHTVIINVPDAPAIQRRVEVAVTSAIDTIQVAFAGDWHSVSVAEYRRDGKKPPTS